MSIKSIYGFQAPLRNINKAKEFLCVTINSLKFETFSDLDSIRACNDVLVLRAKIQFTFPLEIKI